MDTLGKGEQLIDNREHLFLEHSKTTTTGLTEFRPTNNNASDCGYWIK
jgi:hypothetical protein